MINWHVFETGCSVQWACNTSDVLALGSDDKTHMVYNRILQHMGTSNWENSYLDKNDIPVFRLQWTTFVDWRLRKWIFNEKPHGTFGIFFVGRRRGLSLYVFVQWFLTIDVLVLAGLIAHIPMITSAFIKLKDISHCWAVVLLLSACSVLVEWSFTAKM